MGVLMKFKIIPALLSLAFILGNPVDINNDSIEKTPIHHKNTEKRGSKHQEGSKGSQKGMNKTDTSTDSLDVVVDFRERVKKFGKEVLGETASFTSEFTNDLFTSDDKGKDEYRSHLEEHLNSLFASIPQKYIHEGFMDEYFKEFIQSYSEDYKRFRFLPKAVIIVDKSKTCRKDKPSEKEGGSTTKCKSSYYLYYFNFGSEDETHGDNQEKQPDNVYEIAIGKTKGKRRTIAGLNAKDRTTPEGIFWVDRMVEDPVAYYKSAKDQELQKIGPRYGPRMISVGVPKNRRPYDEIAFHGSVTRLQDTIGTDASYGCIRMNNQEIKKLYGLLDEQFGKGIGTLVVITP